MDYFIFLSWQKGAQRISMDMWHKQINLNLIFPIYQTQTTPETTSTTGERQNQPTFISFCKRYSLRKLKAHFSNWLNHKLAYQKFCYHT